MRGRVPVRPSPTTVSPPDSSVPDPPPITFDDSSLPPNNIISTSDTPVRTASSLEKLAELILPTVKKVLEEGGLARRAAVTPNRDPPALTASLAAISEGDYSRPHTPVPEEFFSSVSRVPLTQPVRLTTPVEESLEEDEAANEQPPQPLSSTMMKVNAIRTIRAQAKSSKKHSKSIQPSGWQAAASELPPPLFVRALYDYHVDDTPSALNIRQGDVIQVITQLQSGWWDGVVHGVRGWFPSNYTEVTDQEDADADGVTSDLDDGSKSRWERSDLANEDPTAS